MDGLGSLSPVDSSQVRVLVGICSALPRMDRFRGGRVDWTWATLRVSRSWTLGLRFGVRWSEDTPDEDVLGEFDFIY